MKSTLSIKIPNLFGKKIRLDKVLLKLFSQYSRSIIQKWIIKKCVLVNDKVINKPSTKVLGGEKILVLPLIQKEKSNYTNNINLNIVYEDNDLIIVNKPSNLIVHPYPGHNHGTLLNLLINYYQKIINVPRCGILHRLDKNTTGLMLIAKNVEVYNILIDLMKFRKIFREYKTIVNGNLITGGIIDYPIKRHNIRRMTMTVNPKGRKAITHYRIIKNFKYYTYLRVFLDTGRTHQIRVHMSYINHSIIGDSTYKKKNYSFLGISNTLKTTITKFPRQALHACRLVFKHPIKKEIMEFKIDLPLDMKELLESIEEELISLI